MTFSLKITYVLKTDVMYMKLFICELRIYMKVICDLRGKFPILSNRNKEA